MNKKILSILLAVVLLAGSALALFLVASAETGTEYVIYVSFDGSDSTGTGTETQPFKTVYKAIGHATYDSEGGLKIYGTNDSIRIVINGNVQYSSSNVQQLFTVGTNSDTLKAEHFLCARKSNGEPIYDSEKALQMIPVIVEGTNALDPSQSKLSFSNEGAVAKCCVNAS